MTRDEYIAAATQPDVVLVHAQAEDKKDWRDNPNLPIPNGAKMLSIEDHKKRCDWRTKYNAEQNEKLQPQIKQQDRISLVAGILRADQTLPVSDAEREADRLLSLSPVKIQQQAGI